MRIFSRSIDIRAKPPNATGHAGVHGTMEKLWDLAKFSPRLRRIPGCAVSPAFPWGNLLGLGHA